MRWRSCRILPLLAVAACGSGDGPTTTRSAPGAAVFEVVAADASGGGEDGDDCFGPVSERYTLADGHWRSESRWYADCLDSGRPRSVVVRRFQGRYEVRGTDVTLHHGAGTPGDEEPTAGMLRGDTLTLFGHCAGETRYARLRTSAPP